MILYDERRATAITVPATGVRIGRDPDCEVAFPDDETVVSAFHCRVSGRDDGSWWLEDLGSTNGTWIQGRRLTESERLKSGVRFSLGQRGPSFAVKIPGELARTQAEAPLDLSQPLLRLRRVKGGEDLLGQGRQIVLGRASGCTIPLRTTADTVVSKHHAMVEFDDDGSATLSDLGSKNGTYLNGRPIQARAMLRPGDRIMLGWTGPLFEARIVGTQQMPDGEGAPYQPRLQPPKTLVGMVQSAEERARDAGHFRLGRFATAMASQMVRESSIAFRSVTLVMLVSLAAVVIALYRTTARRQAEAEQRLASAERSFGEQLRSAEQLVQRQAMELERLRSDLAVARRNAVSRSVIDSLERRLREAEAAAQPAPTAAPSSGVASFSQVARDNGRAIGLVVSRFPGGDSMMGSGFAITRSGYFVTNRHVVQDGRGQRATVDVFMAGDNRAQAAEVVAVSTQELHDLAVLRIRSFRGQPVRLIDWTGQHIEQGAPAAVLGFPLGTQLAFDEGGLVSTSLFSGVISQVGADWLRFSGVSFQGVSGSPVFNADGEVVAVHFGGLSTGQGLGFSVRIGRLWRWLPADARAELGR